MFSSPLLAEDRTRLPAPLRRWVGARLSGPPGGPVHTRHRAAIFLVARLGDFVLGLSAIRHLLTAWGEDRCLLVVADATAALARHEFPRTPLLALPLQAPSLIRDLIPAWRTHRPAFRGLAFDDVVCLSHQRDLYKDVALSWLRTTRLHRLDRATFPTTAPADLSLELAAHRQLVAHVLDRPLSAADILPALTSTRATPGDYLLVCPTASEAVRCFPLPLLVETLRLWRARSSARVILCAAPHETAQLTAYATALESAGVGPVERLQPADTLALLSIVAGARALLAIDSAPAHFATALDLPLVLVSGGGTHGLCSPWRRSPRQTVVRHVTPCYYCRWRCHQPEVLCYTRIPPADIAAALPAW